MGTTVDKFEAAFETKDLIKGGINRLGGSLTSESTFRSYATELDNLYDEMPKVTGEGSSLSLTPTREGGLSVIPKGACEQETIAGVAGTTIEGTTISVNDVDSSKENTITPKGACEQDTTTGKNKANIENIEGQYLTITNNTIKLGSSTTYNATAEDCLLKDICPNLVVGETYILTFNSTDSTTNHYNDLYLRTSAYYWGVGTTRTITQNDLDGRVAFYGAVDTIISNFMIRLSSVADASYEPYTNGASPNPDYPQDIRVVTGDNSVVVQNKNIFNDTFLSNHYTKDENGYYTDGILSFNNYFNNNLPNIKFKENTQYTFQWYGYNDTSAKSRIVFHYTDGTKSEGAIITATTDETAELKSLTSTANKTIDYIDFTFSSSGSRTLHIKDIQLEVGSTATTYIAHQEQVKELNLGKNLLNASAESYTMPASTNKYQVVGNVNLVANTKYYISYNIDNASTSNLRSTPYIRIGTGTRMYQNTGENYNITTGRKVWEFTPSETATYDFGYWINGSDVAVTVSDFMISTSSDTTYAPYFTPIELYGIGDYKDKIVKVGDSWKIVRKVRKITYNGSEPWEMYGTSSTSAGRFQIQNGYFKSPATNVVAPIMCDKLITYRKSGLAYGGISGADEDVFRMLVKISADITTVEQLKTWLSSNPLVVYHKLNTYTETTITNTALIEQLEAIAAATNYDGTTNISVEIAQGNAQPYLEYHYNFVTQKPSPDRPSEVKVVTGDNSVVVQNKNFLKESVFTVVGNNYQFYKDDLFLLKAGITYTASYSGEEIPVIYFAKPISGYYINTTGKSLTYTPPEDQLCFIQFTKSGGLSENIIDYQLEINSTATSHVIHAEQTYTLHLGTNYLAGIGDYKDEIGGKTDEWKIKRYVGKVVLNGSEDWGKHDTFDGWFWVNNVFNGYFNRDANNFALCDYYIQDAYANVTTMESGKFAYNELNATTKRLVIRNTDITTAENFKTWLSNHNTTIYYRLVAPTEETITNQTLITDLNNMYQAMGYDGTTNITITSDSNNAQMEANISALKGE